MRTTHVLLVFQQNYKGRKALALAHPNKNPPPPHPTFKNILAPKMRHCAWQRDNNVNIIK